MRQEGALRPETTTPAGGGDPAGVVFVAGYREEVAPTISVSSREEVGPDEIPFAILKRGKTFFGTTPAAGGGAAGAVSMASDREEVNAGRIRQGRGGGRPWRNSLDRLAGDRSDFVADDAEIVELTVRKATQLGNGVAVNAPVTIVADQVH